MCKRNCDWQSSVLIYINALERLFAKHFVDKENTHTKEERKKECRARYHLSEVCKSCRCFYYLLVQLEVLIELTHGLKYLNWPQIKSEQKKLIAFLLALEHPAIVFDHSFHARNSLTQTHIH